MVDEDKPFEKNLMSTLKYFYYTWGFKCLHRKEEEINDLNKEIINNLSNFYHSINDNIFKQNIILNDFTKNELIEKIFEKINFDNYIEKFVENFIIKNREDIIKNKPKSINILVIGNSGVGKSTLINSFFNMNKAETGIGESVTKDFIPYNNPNNQNDPIKLIDSKGIESYPSDLESILKYICGKLNSDDKNEFIHCIWYCCTYTRFNKKNYDEIKKLLHTYEDDYLPVIIVKTNSDYEIEDDEFLKKIKDYLKDFKQLEYVKVLAKERHISPFGLEQLKDISLSKIGQAVKSSLYQSIRERINSLYNQKIEEKFQILKDKIETIQHNDISFDSKIYETIFYEVLNIIFFNDDEEHNIKELLNEKNPDESNNNIISSEKGNSINDETSTNIISFDENDNEEQKLINNYKENIELNNINKYNTFKQDLDILLNKLNNEFKKIYEDKIWNIYENVLGEKFENLNKANNSKIRIFNDINGEIRNLNGNKDFEIEMTKYKSDKIDLTTTQIIKIEDQKENTTHQNKTEIFKINYQDVFILIDIKKKFIRKSLNFFAVKLLNYVKEKMESELYYHKLNVLIGSRIIEKLKSGQFN